MECGEGRILDSVRGRLVVGKERGWWIVDKVRGVWEAELDDCYWFSWAPEFELCDLLSLFWD